jgi:hypothetical protein
MFVGMVLAAGVAWLSACGDSRVDNSDDMAFGSDAPVDLDGGALRDRGPEGWPADGCRKMDHGDVWGDAVPNDDIGPEGGPKAATDLAAVGVCPDMLNPYLDVTWTPAQQTGTAQRIEMTIFKIATGPNSVTKPLSAAETSLRLPLANTGQAIVRWRVLTLHDDGIWSPSTTVMEQSANVCPPLDWVDDGGPPECP